MGLPTDRCVVQLLTYQWVPEPSKPAWWRRSEDWLQHARLARLVGATCCLEYSLMMATGWCSR